MRKVQVVKEGRDIAGQFIKGNKLQVSRKPITRELLERAIEKVEKRHDTRLIEYIIERAFKDDKVLMKLVDKFVPNLTIAERDIKPIQIAIKNYYASPDMLPRKEKQKKFGEEHNGTIIEAKIIKEEVLDIKQKGD
ncbi:MAG: hypothetical protein E3J83_03380 [Candidatus Atribacteria bacterium]|nr:MAG: hypothetical protein E3J83_03380 [Candidatus Atribacteria bacterium]